MLANGILESFPEYFSGGSFRYGWIWRQQPYPDAQNYRPLLSLRRRERGTRNGIRLDGSRVILCAAHQANLIVQYICKAQKGE